MKMIGVQRENDGSENTERLLPGMAEVAIRANFKDGVGQLTSGAQTKLIDFISNDPNRANTVKELLVEIRSRGSIDALTELDAMVNPGATKLEISAMQHAQLPIHNIFEKDGSQAANERIAELMSRRIELFLKKPAMGD